MPPQKTNLLSDPVLTLLERSVLILFTGLALLQTLPSWYVDQRGGWWKAMNIGSGKAVTNLVTPGLREAEDLQYTTSPRVSVQVREVSQWGDGWSEGKILESISSLPGDWIEFSVPSPKKGIHRLFVHLTRSNEYGAVQLYWNGELLGGPIPLNLPNNRLIPTGPIDLGNVHIDRGSNRLRVQSVQHTIEEGTGRFNFSIDGFVLSPVSLD